MSLSLSHFGHLLRQPVDGARHRRPHGGLLGHERGVGVASCPASLPRVRLSGQTAEMGLPLASLTCCSRHLCNRTVWHHRERRNANRGECAASDPSSPLSAPLPGLALDTRRSSPVASVALSALPSLLRRLPELLLPQLQQATNQGQPWLTTKGACIKFNYEVYRNVGHKQTTLRFREIILG